MTQWVYPFRDDPIFSHLCHRAGKTIWHHRKKDQHSKQYKPISLRTSDLDEAKREYLRIDGEPAIDNRKITCTQAFPKFIERLKKRGRKSRTIRRYECAWDNDIKKYIGRMPVHAVEPKDVLRVLDKAKARVSERTGQKLSKDSLYQIHATMSAFFAYCAQPTVGYRRDNPSALLGDDKPAMGKVTEVTDDKVFSAEEMDEIAALLGDDENWASYQRKVIVLFSAEVGTRISETLALQLPHVDRLRKRLRIEQQLAFYEDRRAQDPTTWFDTLKGEDDRIGDKKRTVPLSPFALEIIEAYIDRGSRESRLRPGGLLFPSSKNTPIEPSRISEHLRKISKQLGRTVRAHYFRHTYATTLVSNGVQVERVQKLLGHSDQKVTTDRYAKFRPSDEVMEEIGNLGRQATGRS